MHTSTPRWLFVASLATVLILSSGCFQAVGDQAEGTVVAERLTETPTSPPTATVETTAEATEETEEAPLGGLSVAESETATATLYLPSDTPSVTNTAADLPLGNVEGTAVAQDLNNQTPTPDDFQLTSTALIQQATDRVATLTQEALGPPPTATPTASPTSDGSNLFPTTQAPVFGGGDCVHEVRQGDNMYRLSVTYGVPINTIAAANGIVNPRLILIGQRITIPGCGTTGAVPPPTSTTIPTRTPAFGTGGAGQGGGSTTTTNPPTGGVSVCGPQYIVQQYDTLFQISLRCGVPVASIAAANGITDISYIQFGDVLTIPPQ
jgi:LysM repeat protein